MPDRARKIFISYRRTDTGADVRSLRLILEQAFGPHNVFVDHEAIRVGDKWPQQIERALEAADIVLVAMGPSWLRVADEHGRRRLDHENDWVRNEISRSLALGKQIIPLLIGRVSLPAHAALPECLTGLRDHPAYELRAEYWEQDLSGLIDRLARMGCGRLVATVAYPPHHRFPKALTNEELDEALTHLEGWVLTTSMIPGQEPKTRTELMKSYQFAGFEAAMAFMQSAI